MNYLGIFFQKYDFIQAGKILNEIGTIIGYDPEKWNNDSISKYNDSNTDKNILEKYGDFFYLIDNNNTFKICIDYLKKITIYKTNGEAIRLWVCNEFMHKYIIKNYLKELYIKKDNEYILFNNFNIINNFDFYEREYYYKYEQIKKLNYKDYIFDINDDYIKLNFPNKFKEKNNFFLNIPNDDIKEITYFHNKKIGMTYQLIKNVINERMYSNFKILYLNIGLLKVIYLDKLKDYFYYYCSMLFKYEELNEFNNKLYLILF